MSVWVELAVFHLLWVPMMISWLHCVLLDPGSLDQEWKAYLSNLAFERVRKVFPGQASEVFSLSLDGIPVEDIARRLGITRDSVYTLKNRFRKRLIKDINDLMNELEF